MKRKQIAWLLCAGLLSISQAGPFMADDLTDSSFSVSEEDAGAAIDDAGLEDGDIAIEDAPGIAGEGETDPAENQEEESELPSQSGEVSQEDVSGLIEDTGKVATDSVPESETAVIPGFYVDPTQYPAANITVNTSFVYFYLRNRLGLNHAAACGVLSNMQLESNFRPIALGDGGTSYGVCQWHLDRFSSLIYYCNSRGLDYNTLTGQLEYLNYELTHGYSGVLSYLRNIEDSGQGAYNAAYVFCMYFESPDQTQARSMQRGNLAENEYFARTFDTEDDRQIEADVKKFIDSAADGDLASISLITGSLLRTDMMPVSSYTEEAAGETGQEDVTEASEGVAEPQEDVTEASEDITEE